MEPERYFKEPCYIFAARSEIILETKRENQMGEAGR
jgi:hypothetical protein